MRVAKGGAIGIPSLATSPPRRKLKARSRARPRCTRWRLPTRRISPSRASTLPSPSQRRAVRRDRTMRSQRRQPSATQPRTMSRLARCRLLGAVGISICSSCSGIGCVWRWCWEAPAGRRELAPCRRYRSPKFRERYSSTSPRRRLSCEGRCLNLSVCGGARSLACAARPLRQKRVWRVCFFILGIIALD